MHTKNILIIQFLPFYTYDNTLLVSDYQDLNADVFCCKKARYIQTYCRLNPSGPNTSCDRSIPSSECEKSFRARIVVWVSFSAHATFNIVFSQVIKIGFTTILAYSVAIKYQSFCGFSTHQCIYSVLILGLPYQHYYPCYETIQNYESYCHNQRLYICCSFLIHITFLIPRNLP